jgi:peptide/nickel transport system substrate-binding protein
MAFVLLVITITLNQDNLSLSALTLDKESSVVEGVTGNTIVIGMFLEPDSLYLYGTSMLAASHVMEAFMDGPIDSLDYDYQPVILENVPSLDNGDAVINSIVVNTGDLVLNAFGVVATLTPGETIVNSAGQTVVFDGTPVTMSQITVNFTMKPNIFWSDGVLLTTNDSVLSQQIDCHPDTPTSKFVCDRTASYTAPNNQTAIWQGIPGFMDSDYFLRFWTPLPLHVLDGTPPGSIPASGYATNPLGWGAFKVDQWIPGDSIHLSRNPYYWRANHPKVDNLIFKFYASSSEAYAALLAGEIHVVTSELSGGSTLLPTFMQAEADGSISIHASPGTVIEYINFGIFPADARHVFFDDVEVRRALTLCTNRQEMNNSIFLGQAETLQTYVPPNHPIYIASNVTEWPYDPVQGRAKLDAVGWLMEADGWRHKNGQRFAITLKLTSGNSMREQIGEIFRANMANCGIDVTLEFLPAAEFFASGPDGPVWGRKFDAAQTGWLTGFEPACNLYLTDQIPDENNSWSGANIAGYSNPSFDAACNLGIFNLLGTSQYTSGHIQALETWSQDVPAIPLFTRVRVALSNPNVTGLQPNPTESSELWNVEEWVISAANTIAVTGGTLVSNDGRVTVQIPTGAFTDTVILEYTPWLPQPTDGLFNGGQFFNLSAVYEDSGQPASLAPGTMYTLTVEYSSGQLLNLGAGVDGLGLYTWDGLQWVLEPTSVLDTTNKTVMVTSEYFGLWALLSSSKPQHTFLPAIFKN